MKKKMFSVLLSIVVVVAVVAGGIGLVSPDMGKVSAETSSSKPAKFKGPNKPRQMMDEILGLEKHSDLERKNELAAQRNKQLNQQIAAVPADPAVTDEVAQGIFLRFIAGNKTAAEKESLRNGYLKQTLGITKSNKQDKLFELAEEYLQAGNQIQIESENIGRKYHPHHAAASAEDQAAFALLAERKKNLVRNTMRKLRQQLNSGQLSDRIEDHIETKVKPRIKVNRH